MSGNELKYKDNRSGIMVNGVGRSGNRALLYSMGLEEDDFRKPIIGIANSFSELVPGHIHLRELARDVSDGILEAGGIPREFDTIALCDGLCQGHSGMRYSLPSREIIADSVEAVVEGNQLDAVVMLASCDKIVPGMILAAARMKIPHHRHRRPHAGRQLRRVHQHLPEQPAGIRGPVSGGQNEL